MKYFLDTEFITYPCTIDLISIGIVNEKGNEFYVESSEFKEEKADDWVRINVISKLGDPSKRLPKYKIAKEIIEFIGYDQAVEFWAWYSAFDWVAFCWLFGKMAEFPWFLPKYCKDIKQLEDSLCFQVPRQKTAHHHALNDARWNKQAYEFLTSK